MLKITYLRTSWAIDVIINDCFEVITPIAEVSVLGKTFADQIGVQ